MPSKLPVIKANIRQPDLNTMKYIAQYHHRSLAAELRYIVEEHILDFYNNELGISCVNDFSVEEIFESED